MTLDPPVTTFVACFPPPLLMFLGSLYYKQYMDPDLVHIVFLNDKIQSEVQISKYNRDNIFEQKK